MIQVQFGDIASYDDLGLWLTDVEIKPPEPRRTLVEIPGMDGSLEITYALSSNITYKNRTINLEFAMADYNRQWSVIFSEVLYKIHGKKFEVIIGDDPEFYWDAFCKVSKMENDVNEGTMKVTLDAYPYKIRREDVIYTVTPTSAGVTQVCKVRGKDTTPWFIGSEDVTYEVTFVKSPTESTTYYLGNTKATFDDFTDGDNTVIIKGSSGVVTIGFREMVL